jgi:GT2 family glycosyltransferase
MSPSPRVSVVVPAFEADAGRLLSLCESVQRQTLPELELIVVDDGSASPPSLPGDPRFRLVSRGHAGPAAARNAGAALARGDILFFTDADCALAPGALAAARAALERADLSAGETVTRPRSPFGRLVALLGYPGGGLLGFRRVWRVGPDGSTDSASGCNLAMKREVFERLGRFDPSFPVAGGEDTVLARTAAGAGLRIVFTPEQLAFHPGRESLGAFLRWHLVRGRGSFHIARRLPRLMTSFAALRLWSLGGSLRAAGWAAPAVLLLWLAMVACQAVGFGLERVSWARRESPRPQPLASAVSEEAP